MHILALITKAELKKHLTYTEIRNRFLWVYVQRSKLLPEGGQFQEENMNDLVSDSKDIVTLVISVFSPASTYLSWRRLYSEKLHSMHQLPLKF